MENRLVFRCPYGEIIIVNTFFTHLVMKKSMGGEMSFQPLVRPHHYLPFVTIVICDLSCHNTTNYSYSNPGMP